MKAHRVVMRTAYAVSSFAEAMTGDIESRKGSSR